MSYFRSDKVTDTLAAHKGKKWSAHLALLLTSIWQHLKLWWLSGG